MSIACAIDSGKLRIGNRPLAMILDGEVVFAPTIKSAISDKAMITGKFQADVLAGRLSAKEAQSLVDALLAGMKSPASQPATGVSKDE